MRLRGRKKPPSLSCALKITRFAQAECRKARMTTANAFDDEPEVSAVGSSEELTRLLFWGRCA